MILSHNACDKEAKLGENERNTKEELASTRRVAFGLILVCTRVPSKPRCSAECEDQSRISYYY